MSNLKLIIFKLNDLKWKYLRNDYEKALSNNYNHFTTSIWLLVTTLFRFSDRAYTFLSHPHQYRCLYHSDHHHTIG